MITELTQDLIKWLDIIFTNTQYGVIIVDPNDRVVFISQVGKTYLKLEEGSIYHHDLTGVITDHEKESIQKVMIGSREFTLYWSPIVQKDIYYGALAIISEKSTDNHLENDLEDAQNLLEVYETVFYTAYEGIIVVDSEGYIIKFNKAYEEFLGLKEDNVVGKHVTEVLENTRMHIVAKTGEAEIGQVQRIQGHEMIASRIPIIKGDKIIGAVGKVLFQDVKELKSLAQKMEVVESKFNYYRKKINKLQEAKYSFDNILTQNKQVQYLKNMARKVAESNSTILLEGETGTGKELFAHAIHKASFRKYGSFVKVNCPAIPKDLLESEFFGYEDGAFTGAVKGGKPGKFELAMGGTIFLDEIGAMPLEMQVKLLRVIQESEFERIGGTRSINLDIRIIAATNESLEELMLNKKFRKDLYYRINVIRLTLPPLRDRKDDIPVIADAITKDLCLELQQEHKEFSTEAMEVLIKYHWPGNIRELHNVIEQVINFIPRRIIHARDLPEFIFQADSTEEYQEEYQGLNLKYKISRVEKEAIEKALIITEGNKSKAAELLGIHRTSLYKKIVEYKIDC